MSNPSKNIKTAEYGAIISVAAYTFLSLIKITSGYFWHSSSLMADGFNNVSDIVSSLAVLVGLRLARKPADRDHRFGHWKFEDLSSLVTSLIMLFIGFQLLITTIKDLINPSQSKIDPIAATVGVVSFLLIFAVYLFNRRLAQKTQSKALKAAAKDNLSDALTSLSTSFAILATYLHLGIMDKVVALIITLLIIKTGFSIFLESAFSLSDGFDESLLNSYKAAILTIPKIAAVKSQRGRMYGSNIYLDLVLEMNPDLSVYESHQITEKVENLLQNQFDVYDIDIHVEPASIPEDESISHIMSKLTQYEKDIFTHRQASPYLSDDFIFIAKSDKDFENYLQSLTQNTNPFTNYHIRRISQKTYLMTYQVNQEKHATLWRRHEKWRKILHQIS